MRVWRERWDEDAGEFGPQEVHFLWEGHPIVRLLASGLVAAVVVEDCHGLYWRWHADRPTERPVQPWALFARTKEAV